MILSKPPPQRPLTQPLRAKAAPVAPVSHLKRWLVKCALWLLAAACCVLWLVPSAQAQEVIELWRAPQGPANSPQAQAWEALHHKVLAANSTTPGCEPVTWPGLDPKRPSYAFGVMPGKRLQKPVIYAKDHVAQLFWLTGLDAKGCPFVRVSGRQVDFNNRDVLSIHPNFELPAQGGQQRLVAIVQADKRLTPAVLLADRSDYEPQSQRVFLALTALATLVMTLLLVSLIFSRRIKDGIVHANMAFTAALWLWLLQSYGMAEAMFDFWPRGDRFLLAQVVSVVGLMLTVALCVAHFTGMRTLRRRVYLGSVALTSGVVMCTPFVTWRFEFAEIAASLYVAITLWQVLTAFIKRRMSDILYGVGLVAFLGAGLTQLVVQVLLPDLVQIDTSLFLPVGATAMCVLWMLATVRRMEEHSHQQVEQLVLESSTDKLTGLWNRDHVTHKVDTFLSKRSSANEVGVGVFLMDLDNFKQINDTMGHQQGDALLKEVGQRIRLILSDTVGDRAVAARFGGDEFVVMTHATVSMAEQHALAQALIDGVSLPMQLASRTLSVKASLGYVRCQGYYDLAEDMIRDADIAMYEAKKRGRGQVVMFEPDMARAVQKRVALERELQQAIKSRELELYFQPIVDISTHRHVGLEALVRWNHPTRGFVNPNDFIPLAEEVGLIADIGRLVMEMAMQSIHAWKLDGLWMPGWYVSVNISGQEISGEGLFEEMENLMARYGLHGHDLRLELTESAVIKNLGMANIELPRFLRRGIALCMDDFGTGYSSLSYLNKLPFNVLKIDKSFIDGLEVSSDQKALVRSVLALARDMKLKVVAEGVEGPGQLALLKTMACDYGQGYYFSKPLSESLTRQWLRDAMVSAEVPEPIDSTSYKAA